MHVLVLSLAVQARAQVWWDPEWSDRARLRFDNVEQATDLVGFPVLVVLRDGENFDHDRADPEGDDLRFVDGRTTLPYEIERWNDDGVSVLWVRVPRIRGSSDSDAIWMYYGRPGADPGEDPGAVWPSEIGVWHLQTADDATDHELDGAYSGTEAAEGIAGGGRRVLGDEGIRVPDDARLDLTSTLTVSVWVQLDPLGDGEYDGFLTKGDAWALRRCGTGRVLQWQVARQSDAVNICAGGLVDDGAWHQLAGSYDADGQMGMYLDGEPVGDREAGAPLRVSAAPLWIGQSEETGGPRGVFDEVRITDRIRSADWIRADWRSVRGDFVTWCSRWEDDPYLDDPCGPRDVVQRGEGTTPGSTSDTGGVSHDRTASPFAASTVRRGCGCGGGGCAGRIALLACLVVAVRRRDVTTAP